MSVFISFIQIISSPSCINCTCFFMIVRYEPYLLYIGKHWYTYLCYNCFSKIPLNYLFTLLYIIVNEKFKLLRHFSLKMKVVWVIESLTKPPRQFLMAKLFFFCLRVWVWFLVHLPLYFLLFFFNLDTWICSWYSWDAITWSIKVVCVKLIVRFSVTA